MKKQVYLLDCTLRDGGYVNNWNFGVEAINGIVTKLEDAGVDIIELGFIRDEMYKAERTVFTNGRDFTNVVKNKKKSVLYSAMIEGGDIDRLFPIERLDTPECSGLDYIRVCTWKRLMKEHFQYCKCLIQMGYKVSIQPTAVEQYSDAEFIELLKLSNEIQPFAVYIVDTWGSQTSMQICHYAELMEEYLDPTICIGYHGHNNMMQALSCSEALLKMDLKHSLCLDSTIMGMGRGIGNLNTEIIMDYLNKNKMKQYDCYSIVDAFEKYVKPFYKTMPWGYSLYHYLSAKYSCPQDFATYFKQEDLGESFFKKFLESLKPSEKIYFDREFVERRILELK